jgi:hypothetical protein
MLTPQQIRNAIDIIPQPGTIDHRDLTNRNSPDQHSIGSITNLESVLNGKAGTATVTSTTDGLMSTVDKANLDGLTAGDARNVKYDANGNISLPPGLSLQVAMPDGATKHSVLATDSNGNAVLGESDIQVNIMASQRPTVKVGTDAAAGIALTTDLTPYITEAEVDAEMAVKADLVSGVVPDSQLPGHVKVNNWTVAAEADLVTLTNATVNDRAFVGTANPYETYYLLALPPTTLANWRQAGAGDGGGGGSGTITSVNGDAGPVVNIDLPQLPGVRNALDDKADAADLADYAPLASPALTGTPTAPTAPANAAGGQIINAEALRAAMTGNLGAVSPLMDGTATAGLASTVARSDHVHPTDITRASLNSPAFVGTPTVPTAPSGTATTQAASTEFVKDAIENAANTPSAAFAMVPDYTAQETVNRIAVVGGSWTVAADGFINASLYSNTDGIHASVLINGNTVNWGWNGTATTLPVKAGDLVSIASNSDSYTASCYFIPPSYIPVNRGYSTDEHLTGETWIDGRAIYSKTLVNTIGAINVEKTIGTFPVGASLVRYDGVVNYTPGGYYGNIPYGAGYNLQGYFYYNAGEFRVTSANANWNGKPVIVTIYYVKP